MKLPRDLQIILGGTVLYVLVSFFDWQSTSVGPYSFGVNEWHGFGVLVALVAVALLVWEVLRVLGRDVTVGSFTPGLISVALAVLLLVLTVIIFLDWSDFRSWPEWVGLILSIVIAVFAVRRGRSEGVEMPQMPKNLGSSGGGSGSSSNSMSSGGADTSPDSGPEGV